MITVLQRERVTDFGDWERNYLYTENKNLDLLFKRKGFKSDANYENALKVSRHLLKIRPTFFVFYNIVTFLFFAKKKTRIWYERKEIKTQQAIHGKHHKTVHI